MAKDLKLKIVEMLLDFGVKEVILDIKDDSRVPTIEFASDDERVIMTNADFSAVGL